MPSSFDWPPSRLDLRRVRRWRRVLVVGLWNLLFLAVAIVMGWIPTSVHDRGKPFAVTGTPFFVVAVTTLILGCVFLLCYSTFALNHRKDQFRLWGRREGLFGVIVRCRYFLDGHELGTDQGLLAYSKGTLRFEGARTRFAISSDMLIQAPDLSVREPEVSIHNGVPMTLRFSAEAGEPAIGLESNLNQWLRSREAASEIVAPTTWPEARSWFWYLKRGIEHYSVEGRVLVFLGMFIKLVLPSNLGVWRWISFLLPLLWLGIMGSRCALRIRREDVAWLQTLEPETVEERPVSPEVNETVRLRV